MCIFIKGCRCITIQIIVSYIVLLSLSTYWWKLSNLLSCVCTCSTINNCAGTIVIMPSLVSLIIGFLCIVSHIGIMIVIFLRYCIELSINLKLKFQTIKCIVCCNGKRFTVCYLCKCSSNISICCNQSSHVNIIGKTPVISWVCRNRLVVGLLFKNILNVLPSFAFVFVGCKCILSCFKFISTAWIHNPYSAI